MTTRLGDFDAVTFDVYGSLIDYEPYVAHFLRDWAKKNRIAVGERNLLLAFDRACADVQKERPQHDYPALLRRCFERISVEFGVEIDPEAREKLARAPQEWPAYRDSYAALKTIQARAKIGALSNTDNETLSSSCLKLNIVFDIVVTAERVGAYKPDLQQFDTAVAEIESLGISRQRILHVGQNLRTDIAPANRLGLRSVWIHRPHRFLGMSGEGASEATPDLTVSSLSELVTGVLGGGRLIAF